MDKIWRNYWENNCTNRYGNSLFFNTYSNKFICRLFGKDLLGIKFQKNKSYWIKRKKNLGTMDKQF